MTPALKQCLCVVLLLAFVPSAYAQEVPGAFAVAVLSPIVMILLAGILGWLDRRPMSGLMHIGLIVLWVAAFLVLSRHVTTDWLIWAPIFLYSIHSLYILIRLGQSVWKRRSARASR